MELHERLHGYTVTAVPGRERLRLLWSVASEVVVSDDGHDPSDASVAGVGAAAPIALLDSYRITRVPTRAAS